MQTFGMQVWNIDQGKCVQDITEHGTSVKVKTTEDILYHKINMIQVK